MRGSSLTAFGYRRGAEGDARALRGMCQAPWAWE